MQSSLLNHFGGFPVPLSVVQGVSIAGTFKYKFVNTPQAVSMGDSGSVDQSTDDPECTIPCISAFQTFGLSWADACSFLTTIWTSKIRTALSLLPRVAYIGGS